MTSPNETAAPHQMVPEDDQNMLERIPGTADPIPADPIPADLMLTETPQSAIRVPVWDPGAAAAGSATEEPDAVGHADAERPPAFPASDADPEPVPASPAVTDTTSPDTRWHEILAMFVDDPRSSVERAAGLVDDSVEALVASVREQQDSLLSGWHDQDAGTEELRTAVQHYRTFWNRLEDFSPET
jgi:hypothetical protein